MMTFNVIHYIAYNNYIMLQLYFMYCIIIIIYITIMTFNILNIQCKRSKFMLQLLRHIELKIQPR